MAVVPTALTHSSPVSGALWPPALRSAEMATRRVAHCGLAPLLGAQLCQGGLWPWRRRLREPDWSRGHSLLAPTTSPYTWRRPTVSGICFASKALVFSQDFRRHLVQSPTQGGASFQRKVLGREATKKVRCFTSRTLRAYARCVGGQQGWWKRRRCCPAETVFSPHFFPTSSSSRSMALFEVRPIQINVSLPVTYSSSSSSCGVSFTLAALNRWYRVLGAEVQQRGHNTCKATSSLRKGGEYDADGGGDGKAVLRCPESFDGHSAVCVCLGGEPSTVSGSWA